MLRLFFAFIFALDIIFQISPLAHSSSKPNKYPTTPILRQELTAHSGQIKRISIDAKEKFVVTASIDKTARVWDLENGDLIQKLRVPIGTDSLGKIYAVSISPDGELIAAAGLTGRPHLGGYAIYIFNRIDGQIIDRIGELPSVINHLAFSHDGSLLVATFGRNGGVKVFNGKTFNLIGEDTHYEAATYWAEFDKNKRIVTASLDGYLRLYETDYSTPKIKTFPPGPDRPYAASFSPGGTHIAVSYLNEDRVDVISGKNLIPIQQLHCDSSHDKAPLTDTTFVSWNNEGGLYAGASYMEGRDSLIHRWTDINGEPSTSLVLKNNSIIDIRSLSNDRIVAASYSPPSIKVIKKNGEVLWERKNYNFSYQVEEKSNRLSSTKSGEIISFNLTENKNDSVYFDITKGLFSQHKPKDKEFYSPITEHKNVEVLNWHNSDYPIVNGTPLRLGNHETSRALSFVPGTNLFYIGSDWSIRLFDINGGKPKAKIKTPGKVQSLVVPNDKEMVIAGLDDGTIRWFRLKTDTLQEILTFLPQKDGRWIIWTPEGYYRASVGGADLVGWHRNNGRDATPNFVSINNLRSHYNNPDLISTILKKGNLKIVDEDKLKVRTYESTPPLSVGDILPPIVSFINREQGNIFSSPNVNLNYSIKLTNDLPIVGIKILLNGRPLPSSYILNDFPSEWVEGEVYDLSLFLPPEDTKISLIVNNRYTHSEASTINLKWSQITTNNEQVTLRGKPSAKQDKENIVNHKSNSLSNLYILSVGASNYTEAKNGAEKLNFSGKDAEDLIDLFKKQQGRGVYSKVFSKLILDPTLDQMLDGLTWIEEKMNSPKDIAIIFFAGHGYSVRRANKSSYYFLTLNAHVSQMRGRALSYTELKETMIALPGKVIFFIDTCHAGQSMGGSLTLDLASVANDLQSTENGIIVFTATQSNELSIESSTWENGAFTEALLEGLKGKAYPDNGKISFKGLDLYISKRVPELVKEISSPYSQTPSIVIPKPISNFDISSIY